MFSSLTSAISFADLLTALSVVFSGLIGVGIYLLGANKILSLLSGTRTY